MIDLMEDYWVYSKRIHPQLKNSSYHYTGKGDLGSINTGCDNFESGEMGFGITDDFMIDPNGGYKSNNFERKTFYFSLKESSPFFWGKYFYY